MASDYISFHKTLLQRLAEQVATSPPFNALTDTPSGEESRKHQETLNRLQQLAQATEYNDDYFAAGQQLIGRFIAGYPHITPIIPRDLLWFFGGDCLHYMPDEEIALFQALDEKRFEAEASQQPFDYEQERARLLKLH